MADLVSLATLFWSQFQVSFYFTGRFFTVYSLTVQWLGLGLGAFTAVARVQFLVGKLRSCNLRRQKKRIRILKKKKITPKK